MYFASFGTLLQLLLKNRFLLCRQEHKNDEGKGKKKCNGNITKNNSQLKLQCILLHKFMVSRKNANEELEGVEKEQVNGNSFYHKSSKSA